MWLIIKEKQFLFLRNSDFDDTNSVINKGKILRKSEC